MKVIDVCNAARYGVDQARRWEHSLGLRALGAITMPEDNTLTRKKGKQTAGSVV